MKKTFLILASLFALFQVSGLVYADVETRILSDGEMGKLYGADVCENCNEGPDSNPDDPDSGAPVFLNN